MKRFVAVLIVLLAALPMAAQLRVIQTRSGGGVLAAPTFSADTGAAQSVTITPPGSATICYTIDGSDPAASTPGTCSAGTTYSAPVAITVTTTFKALATLAGFINSSIATQTYTISAGVPITHVASGTGCSTTSSSIGVSTNTVTWTCSPGAANRALAIGVECWGGSGTATLAALVASPSTGWTFTPITTVTQVSGTTYFATWGAITPNTSSTTFTATFTGLNNCTNFASYYVDEFINPDTTGGTTTFYAHTTPATQTGCATTAANTTSANANDAVWALCLGNLATSAWAGAGWSMGVNDTQGDATIWKVGSGVLTPAWGTNSQAVSLTTTMAIKAQ